ncbi:alpha/beta hydrolase [Phytoactinopolyspora alkaliphila]|uniref:Alpha/beta hydrolase n=1 Tax=Phytoactinopolyspora alkaliphila TaxID=1783498 RepID=A0A6N9YSI0_9ACTN|nr:alpha/beta hydrolase [Phytoactinopolyspora alkaliphila]NED97991.1 alpha/beta hydrolase [Phytoactinopolyspora alkaliphila]
MNNTSQVTSRDGTAVEFYRSGNGPAVILVDGALCHRGFGPAAELAQELSPYFTVYAYDRRGRGRSGDTTPYAVDREIEDIDALMTEAGGSAHVYGISSGAILALRAAASGLAITRLALFEPPCTAEFGDPQEVKDEHSRIDELLAAGRRGDVVEIFLSYVMPPDVIAGMKGSPAWPALEAVAPTIAYDNAVMGDGTVPRDVAGKVKVPTLVLAGTESPEILRQSARALADATPRAVYRTLDNQTHTSAPQPHAPILREFFSAPDLR